MNSFVLSKQLKSIIEIIGSIHEIGHHTSYFRMLNCKRVLNGSMPHICFGYLFCQNRDNLTCESTSERIFLEEI